MSKSDAQFAEQEVAGLEACGFVEPTKSLWAFPAIVVHCLLPTGNKRRMVIDFRVLNQQTQTDAYPMPDCDSILACLRAKKKYVTLDIKSGFQQVQLDDMARECCVFVTQDGQYRYNQMAFELKNAPAFFQLMMSGVLRDYSDRCLIYKNDIVVWDDTSKEYLASVQAIICKLKQAGITCNGEKCYLLSTKIEMLGHIV